MTRADGARHDAAITPAVAERVTRHTAAAGSPRPRGEQKAALRAAGVPPQIAAALRGRLRLIPEQEAGR